MTALLALWFAAGALDFKAYVKRVEPIFVKQRSGAGRCVDCHASPGNQSAFRLEPVGANGKWIEAQSKRNFEALRKLVTPGEPMKSRLLLHPLAKEAGGDEFHTGGKYWKSRRDPEWRVLEAWVRSR